MNAQLLAFNADSLGVSKKKWINAQEMNSPFPGLIAILWTEGEKVDCVDRTAVLI